VPYVNNRRHKQNLSSTSGEAEPFAQYFFKIWNTGNTEEEKNNSNVDFI
jgi:hypothetical protein